MLHVRTGSKHLIREINQAIVINAIRTHGALSRTEIAQLSNLGLPTVSAITAELLETGLIYQHATEASTGGRPRSLLALNPQAGYVVGVKLTETRAILVLTDLEATIVARGEASIAGRTPAQIADTLARAIATLRLTAGSAPILGVGVGVAGVVDRSRALVHHATYFGWRDLPFGELLEAQLDLPVVLDNDVNALAAAEQWFGAGRNVANFLVISLGRGIGMGMVLDGRLYRGAHGGAGEFGHITVTPDGAPCACGKRGCLEAYVSDPALAEQAGVIAGQPMTIEATLAAAQAGDLSMRTIFAHAGQTLGIAAANVVNILNPQLIIVGGEGTRAGALLLEPFAASLRAHCFDGLLDNVQIVTDPWGDEAWARGAASLLLGELFAPALHAGETERPSLTARPTR